MKRGFRIACCLLTAAWTLAGSGARAQDSDTVYGQLETKYLFGFTTGADIGAEGEKEVSAAVTGAFGKRAGRYAVLEHKLEYETTISQFVQIELGILGSTHTIRNVPGFDNINKSNVQGLFGEIRYLLIEKTPNSPFGLTLSFEPNWARIDDSTGQRVVKYEFETKLQADYELVRDRVWIAANLIYEPELVRDVGTTKWEREANYGISTAIAFRILPNVVIGGETAYFRRYENSLLFKTYEGHAIYAGPTLYVQLTRKAFLQAAFSTQIGGHSVDNPGLRMDLDNFPRHRARLKLGVEF